MNFLNKIITQVHAVDVVGTISVPGGVPSDVGKSADFISAIIKLVMIVGGIFTFWQFLSGGLQFITSGGDKGKISEAQQKIQMSITGLVIMTASFILIGVVSLVLFGNFTHIINPVLTPVTP